MTSPEVIKMHSFYETKKKEIYVSSLCPDCKAPIEPFNEVRGHETCIALYRHYEEDHPGLLVLYVLRKP